MGPPAIGFNDILEHSAVGSDGGSSGCITITVGEESLLHPWLDTGRERAALT